MAPSPAVKALAAIISKITPIFNNYLGTFRNFRKLAFTILVLVFAGTVALSFLSPFKLFPKQKSILQLRKDFLARAIKNALKTTPKVPQAALQK
jgi:hypothetical protein